MVAGLKDSSNIKICLGEFGLLCGDEIENRKYVDRLSCRNHIASSNASTYLELGKNTGADECKMKQADQPNISFGKFNVCRRKNKIKYATFFCLFCIMFSIMQGLPFWKHICRSQKPWYSLGQIVITILLITHVVLVSASLSIMRLYDGKMKALQLGGVLIICAIFAQITI